jgi:hypothetical protein
VLRFAPIPSLSLIVVISPIHKVPSISIHSRLGVFGHARRSSWWSVERPPPRAGAKVRSYPIPPSLFVVVVWSGVRAPCYFYVLAVVVVWSGARLVTLLFSFMSCSEAHAGVLTLVFRVS